MTCVRPGVAASLVVMAAMLAAQPVWTQSGLKIVVVEGEDAVNIIQQKTAVAPVIEVRDRNDQPVAGAIVNFAIRGGRATFGGAQALTVTTNAVGQAVATGLTPTASGALQISATAAFQGQTAAAVTIAQTNVMTAAQAAALTSAAGTGGGSGASAGAGAGAGGGGGGLSATTIAIIGGAAAGGAVVATQVAGSETATAQPARRYSGALALDMQSGCLTQRHSATLTIAFEATSDLPDTVVSNGTLTIQNGTTAVVSRPQGCGVLSGTTWGMGPGTVNGTLSNLQSHFQDTVTSLLGTPLDRSFDFSGAVANDVINGSVAMAFRDVLGSIGTAGVTLNRVAQ